MHGTIKIRKWGGSLGIVIPYFVARELNLKVGSHVGMTYDQNAIILKIKATNKEKLDTYLAQVLFENQRFISGEDTGRTADDILE
jgi:antitoxin component of MazEF toxin-antitoxin module